MSELDWHRGAATFKRRVAAALSVAAARFESRFKEGASPASPNTERQSETGAIAAVPKDEIPVSRESLPPGAFTAAQQADLRSSEDAPYNTPETLTVPARSGAGGDEFMIDTGHTDHGETLFPVSDMGQRQSRSSSASETPPSAVTSDRLLVESDVGKSDIRLMDSVWPPADTVESRALPGPSGPLRLDLSVDHENDRCRRLLAIADSENVTTPVEATLHYAGVTKKNGEIRRRMATGLQIVHTGDMLLKHRPDPAVARYWLSLGERLGQLGGKLVLLAGNHELEIWESLRRRERLGLKRRHCEQVRAFIARCDLFCVAGSIMFVHGYPTLNLLRRLQQFRADTGLPVNDYNEQCFRPAFADARKLSQYRYLRGKGCRKLLLHDLESPASYFRTHGKEIAALLRELGIEQVVHGHRPERSGIQADYEFRRWLPGIRMIGNDTQLRQRGLGAVAFRLAAEGAAELQMVNTRISGGAHRKMVRRFLRKDSGKGAMSPKLRVSRLAGMKTGTREFGYRVDLAATRAPLGLRLDNASSDRVSPV